MAACLATATARRSGSWMTQEPTAARSVAVAATVRTTMHSRHGPCQNRWSQAQRAPAPASSAWSAQVGQLGQRIGVRTGPVARIDPGRNGVLDERREDQSDGAEVARMVVPGAHRMVPPGPSDRGHRRGTDRPVRTGRPGPAVRRCTGYPTGTAEWGPAGHAARPCRSLGTDGRTTHVDTRRHPRIRGPGPSRCRRRRPISPTTSAVPGWPRSTRSSSSCARPCRPTGATWP